jgi:hypothetical protein
VGVVGDERAHVNHKLSMRSTSVKSLQPADYSPSPLPGCAPRTLAASLDGVGRDTLA